MLCGLRETDRCRLIGASCGGGGNHRGVAGGSRQTQRQQANVSARKEYLRCVVADESERCDAASKMHHRRHKVSLFEAVCRRGGH